MDDETTSTATLTDGAVRWIDRNGAATRAEVRALAAELLAARETIARQVEQLRAADALADEARSYVDIGHSMNGEHVDLDAAIAAYRRARGAR